MSWNLRDRTPIDPLRAPLPRIGLYVAVARAVTRAAGRRLLHGAQHTGWTWSYELAMTALRVAAREHQEVAMELARKQVAPLPRSLRGRVRVDSGTLAKLATDIHTSRAYQRSTSPVVLFLHGGCYATCSPGSHRDVVARIADVAGARCYAPDYRLAPAHPFPAALDDAEACYRALLTEGVAPRRLYIAGDSAGGGLTMALLLRLRDAGSPLPRAVVLLSPWVDLTLDPSTLLCPAGDFDYQAVERMKGNAQLYAGRELLSHPSISPLYAELHGLPPMLIQTGELEVFRGQNEQLAHKARAAGVRVQHSIGEGMLHAFSCFAGLGPQGAKAIEEIGHYLKELNADARDDQEGTDGSSKVSAALP